MEGPEAYASLASRLTQMTCHTSRLQVNDSDISPVYQEVPDNALILV